MCHCKARSGHDRTGSLSGRGPGSLLIEALVHSRALHGGWPLDSALVADLDFLAAGVAIEPELDGIPLHRAGDLGFTKNLAIERSRELFSLLLEDDRRASRALVRLHGQLPRTGDIGRKRERHTKHQRADRFEHGSSAITISESGAVDAEARTTGSADDGAKRLSHTAVFLLGVCVAFEAWRSARFSNFGVRTLNRAPAAASVSAAAGGR